MSHYRIAILGATGLVGQELLKILEQRRFPVSQLRLLASDRSAGKRMPALGHEHLVEEVSAGAFHGADIAFFAAGERQSREWAPVAVKQGAVVIDKSNAWRMDPEVPLVVPEVNSDDLPEARNKGIIASPNCSTIQMVVALAPLHRANPITRVIVSTYQSTSGAGSAAVDELTGQVKQVLEGKQCSPQALPHQIAFNVLPHIDSFSEDGYTGEEHKMVNETRKIMHVPDLPIGATCVRVPTYIGHAESVNLEFASGMDPREARRILSRAPGIRVMDDPSQALYPLPWSVAGTDEVFVGRIRRDTSHPRGLALWIVADNLRKGAALNAVQIAEEMARRGLLRVPA